MSDEAVQYGPRPSVPTKVDPYKGIILSRLAEYPALTAMRLFEEIKASGYVGCYTQVKEYVRKVRPRVPEEPAVRFETPPGHQGQVDFADFRLPLGQTVRVPGCAGVFARPCGCSSSLDRRCSMSSRASRRPFSFFGGVPHELLFDQMKAVVTKDERAAGGRVTENAEFLRFAHHWNFRIRACRPYRAKTKGKLERPVSYVPFELFLRPDLHVGRGSQPSGPPLARSRGQRTYAWHTEGAARRSLRAGARPAAALGLVPIPILGTAARGDTAGQGLCFLASTWSVGRWKRTPKWPEVFGEARWLAP